MFSRLVFFQIFKDLLGARPTKCAPCDPGNSWLFSKKLLTVIKTSFNFQVLFVFEVTKMGALK
jgi:hypothetical protein